jgi:hypothetical protein
MFHAFITEVWQLGYQEEPDYNKLKFMLTKILIDKGDVPKMNLLDEEQPINEEVVVERDDLFDGVDNLIIANEHPIVVFKKKKA